MQVVTKVSDLREYVKKAKRGGKTIGFVPTMGYFHQGHLSLMQKARKVCDEVIISVFVNPLQFGPNEDLKDYPQDLGEDLKKAKKVGVDLVFAPQVEEMYPESFSTYVEVSGSLVSTLCGRSRPFFFKGVNTVVAKLFELVRPDKAFFGQKDYQQLKVIEKMVKELNMDIEIVSLPIVREKDGLALSSRNTYLNKEERKRALVLYNSLSLAKELIESGRKNAEEIRKEMEGIIKPKGEIDYIAIANPETLKEVEGIKGKVLVALAVKIGKARLIDNMII